MVPNTFLDSLGHTDCSSCQDQKIEVSSCWVCSLLQRRFLAKSLEYFDGSWSLGFRIKGFGFWEYTISA